MKSRVLATILVLLASSALGSVTRAQYLMGTICEISVPSSPRADSQINAAFAEAARIEQLLSTWREDSALSRLNRGKGASSRELYEILKTATSWSRETKGAFNPLVRPLIDVWQTRAEGGIPSDAAIRTALARVAVDNVQFGDGRIVLANGARFEEGAFGKGYAIDKMIGVLRADGAESALINFGGQLAAFGEPREVHIADPAHRDRPLLPVIVRNQSLSTSSGSEKSFTVAGRRFTHIIDPRTGMALPPRGSVSVIHESALVADILSTALYVMGPEEGTGWARDHSVQATFLSDDLAELRRQIDVLTQEIEALKSGQLRKPAEANESQFGLGAAASKVYRAEPGVAIGGYGEFLYKKSRQRASADFVRAVLYAGYKFNDRVVFNSETEVEHANVEHGGNVEMEFGYLDYLLKPQVNVRAGLVLVPVGLINELHEPTAYFGARRPVVEDRIIPSTWSELGAGAFGDIGRFSYRAYLVTGLQASRFGAEGIREGRQGGAEAAATDWAVAGRADWHPVEGTTAGASLYSGNSGQGAGFAARVTLGEVHAVAKLRGFALRGLYARGTIGDAARVNEANGLSGAQSIGKTFGGWYLEGGYDLASGHQTVTPFARYERFDTQRSVPSGFQRNPENDGRVLTLGIGYKPIPQSVIKVDWQRVTNGARTGVSQFNVGLGYIF